jgi:co-chaperonin GroES (HSP10)
MKPTYDNLFVTEVQRESTTKAGIILTGEVETGIKPAVILAAGPEAEAKPGLKCYVKWGEAAPVTHEGTKGAIISEKFILAYID